MGFNLVMCCETCEAQTGVIRGYESEAIAIFAAHHPNPHTRKVYVDNGWSGDTPEHPNELVFPHDYAPAEQPAQFRERGH